MRNNEDRYEISTASQIQERTSICGQNVYESIKSLKEKDYLVIIETKNPWVANQYDLTYFAKARLTAIDKRVRAGDHTLEDYV